MDSSPLTRFPRVTPAKFATIYVIWSLFWVFGSDYITHVFLHGPTIEWKIQSYKGATYVLVSGLILLLSIRERDLKHRAERAANESMVRSLRRSGLIGIYQWHTDGSITDANSSFLEALGYTVEDLRAGRVTMQDLTPAEYWEQDCIAAQEVADTGHCALYEKQVICKDGTRLDVLVGRSLLDGYSDRGIGYAADITELKAAQAEKSKLADQLLRAEKLNALGKLAGGVAHDFNNLLSVVVGYASLTESRLLPGDPVRKHATQILSAADKAQKLVRKLMAFSRKQVLVPELLNVNSLITELHGILDRLLDKRIEVIFRLDPALGQINADATQVEQVIMNLIINARDAMPEGGILTVETSNIKVPQEASHMQVADDLVMIRITDTGTGMPPEVRERIFEPFYTTKEESGGTGLGLATVYGIVNQSGGRISVDSAVGHGSTFTVCFPRAHGPRFRMQKSEQTSAEFGQETILLAEDREDVREMLALTLQSKGYHVIQAGDGEQAVDTARTFAGNIHLMVTDVVMPHLSGADAVRQIRQFRPDLKVVFITGYAEQSCTQPDLPSSVVLEKPLLPDVLLTRIRELLDRGPVVTGTSRSSAQS
jgi:PAS domain S-box-containing protein